MTLFILGMGPGDPELLTLKAARILRDVRVVAFFAKRGRRGHARGAAEGLLAEAVEEIRFEYPFTTEVAVHDPDYAAAMGIFYDECAARLSHSLAAAGDVALLCEGDAFFYGSAMYLFDRLRGAYPVEVVPGVMGMTGGWAGASLPMTHGDDVLSVIPGTLGEAELIRRLTESDAAVIMKLGRNLPKIRVALEAAGRARDAVYVERATMAGERIMKLDALDGVPAPYFSLVLVPGRQKPRQRPG